MVQTFPVAGRVVGREDLMRLLGAIVGVLLAFAAVPTYAHGGGLNHCGCHVNHATGDCHCHRDYGDCSCTCRPASCGGNTSCTDAKAEPGPLLASRGGSVRVGGHTTKSGKYVAPHMRSAPDHSKANNWSTKGNSDPYTGKKGTHNVK
jgi:hypothetical protein